MRFPVVAWMLTLSSLCYAQEATPAPPAAPAAAAPAAPAAAPEAAPVSELAKACAGGGSCDVCAGKVSHAVQAVGKSDPGMAGVCASKDQVLKVYGDAGFNCGRNPSWKDNPKTSQYLLCSRHFHNDRGNYDQCVYSYIDCGDGLGRCKWDTRCTTDKCEESKTPLPMEVEKPAPAKGKGKTKGKRR